MYNRKALAQEQEQKEKEKRLAERQLYREKRATAAKEEPKMKKLQERVW